MFFRTLSLFLFVLHSLSAYAARESSLYPVDTHVWQWETANNGAFAGNNSPSTYFLRTQVAVRLVNISSASQTVTVSILDEKISTFGLNSSMGRPTSGSNANLQQVTLAGYEVKTVYFNSCCNDNNPPSCSHQNLALEWPWNFPSNCPYVFTRTIGASFVGHYTYITQSKISVQQERGAIVASMRQSVDVSGWVNYKLQVNTAVFNGGRPF